MKKKQPFGEISLLTFPFSLTSFLQFGHFFREFAILLLQCSQFFKYNFAP